MSKSAEHHLRSFGMTGYLVTDELKNVEKQYGLELGHVRSDRDSAYQYYPQFEQTVRSEASRMSRHYEVFYCLETSIRKLISDTLLDEEGANWWDSGRIPQNIHDEVKSLVKKEVDSGITQRSENMIDYTTFGQLSDLITKNWDLFEPIFSSQNAVRKVMHGLNMLRGPIAHCCPMEDDEIDRLRLAVKDWFRMMA